MRITNNNINAYGSVRTFNKPVFRAVNLHILDGSGHGENMKHFAESLMKGIGKEVNIVMHEVDTNKVDKNLKQMGSLEDVLKSVAGTLQKGDYLAIPGLAPVPVLNLKDRIRDIMGVREYLTSQNIHHYKGALIGVMNRLYFDKSSFSREQLFHMDKNQQDLGHTFGVINEINKLVKNGVNVYIPSGHGYDSGVKWMSEQKNLKNELYQYIAKGRDKNGSVTDLFDEVRTRNLYDFNLLSLSDAHVVNVNGADGKNYVFSAEDLFVNDEARGVYNFTPVRDWSGNILGYSYHDAKTVEYPFNEFTANSEIANLCKFVGREYRDFRSSHDDDLKLSMALRHGKSTSDVPDKLYRIADVYEQREIDGKGLNLLGHLTDRDRKLVFDTNSSGEVLFQKTNCEGSERPSVLSMWGSCFATFNAIKRDILKGNAEKTQAEFYVKKGDSDFENGLYSGAEYYYNRALDILHPNKMSLNMSREAYNMYKKLYIVLKKSNKFEPAKNIANTILDFKAQRINDLWSFSPVYIAERNRMAGYYDDIRQFCLNEGDYYSARVCEWAVEELRAGSKAARKIINRRADRNSYIGDIYNENR